MTGIKADPLEMRQLADELRSTGAALEHLGPAAVAAVASAVTPTPEAVAAAGAFASRTKGHGLDAEARALRVKDTARRFELLDRMPGWFSEQDVALAFAGIRQLKSLKGKLKPFYKASKHVPHSLKKADWVDWRKKLGDRRTTVSRYFGGRGVLAAAKSWGRAQRRMLTNPGRTVAHFARDGKSAIRAVGKEGAALARLRPIAKFGGRIAGKVLKPLNIIQSYRSSSSKTVLGKVTSVALSTLVTKAPPVLLVDIVTGGQVTNVMDGAVSGVEAVVGGERELADWSDANDRGENGWAMKQMQRGGTALGGALFDGWSGLTGGR